MYIEIPLRNCIKHNAVDISLMTFHTLTPIQLVQKSTGKSNTFYGMVHEARYIKPQLQR